MKIIVIVIAAVGMVWAVAAFLSLISHIRMTDEELIREVCKKEGGKMNKVDILKLVITSIPAALIILITVKWWTSSAVFYQVGLIIVLALSLGLIWAGVKDIQEK